MDFKMVYLETKFGAGAIHKRYLRNNKPLFFAIAITSPGTKDEAVDSSASQTDTGGGEKEEGEGEE